MCGLLLSQIEGYFVFAYGFPIWDFMGVLVCDFGELGLNILCGAVRFCLLGWFGVRYVLLCSWSVVYLASGVSYSLLSRCWILELFCYVCRVALLV